MQHVVKMAIKVKCPTCGRECEYSDKNPYRPFCCERCRLIDLGAWAEGKYSIKDKPMEGDDDLDISADALATGQNRLSQGRFRKVKLLSRRYLR